MSLLDRFRADHVIVEDEETMKHLLNTGSEGYVTEVIPPSGDLPASIAGVIRTLTEARTKFLGFKNTSTTITFEIRRSSPDRIRFLYSVPTKKLDRSLRNQLATVMPGTRFRDGISGVPVFDGESIGGGFVTVGDGSWKPLYTDHSRPPLNHVVANLHRDAMPSAKFIIQVMYKPLIRNPVSRRVHGRLVGGEVDHLRKEKEKIWGSRKPRPAEKRIAREIDEKSGLLPYKTTIRILVINGGEHTASRVYEAATGFSVYGHDGTGQYLKALPYRTFRPETFLDFAEAVGNREWNGWSRWFQATHNELGVLTALPDVSQYNIPRSHT